MDSSDEEGDSTMDPWGPCLEPWGGDADALLREALAAARTNFRSAHERYGIAYEDIAQDACLKLLRLCRAGATPSRALLRFCVRKAGLSRCEWDRPGGIHGPRRPLDPGTTVVANAAALDMIRESLRRQDPLAVPLTRSDDRPIDPPATGDLAQPDELAVEGNLWLEVARQLHEHFFKRYPEKMAAWKDRVALSEACGRVGEHLALRAAHDLEFRHRYVDWPLLMIWHVLRDVEVERFGHYPADDFPPRRHDKDRRYAYRLANKVRDAICVFLRAALP